MAYAPLTESETFPFRSKDEVITGYSFNQKDITSIKNNRIQVKYPSGTQCRITDWSITPSKDTDDYKLQNSDNRISLKTETQGYS